MKKLAMVKLGEKYGFIDLIGFRVKFDKNY